VFSFSITNAGSYAIQATVNAPGQQPRALGVNIDAEPKEPEMLWEIAGTSGFQTRTVGWRGHGTSNTRFSQQTFNLSAGGHQLIVRGRDADIQLQRVSILPVPPSPTGLHVVAGP